MRGGRCRECGVNLSSYILILCGDCWKDWAKKEKYEAWKRAELVNET